MGKQLIIASGRHFNLSCEAEGTPPPSITWFKDGSRITNTSIKHVRGTSVMAFTPVRPENRGHYWCEANSTEGRTQSPTVFLTGIKKKKKNWQPRTYIWAVWTGVFFHLPNYSFLFLTAVKRGPYFVIHPEDVSVYEGQNVTLFCGAAGFPEPVIGWLKDNVSIGNFSSVGGNSSLALRFVERQATNAKYRCVARNSLGKTFSSEATLTVLTRQTTRSKNSMAIL